MTKTVTRDMTSSPHASYPGPHPDLPRSLARLGGALRAAGVSTSVRDEIDAARALPLIDGADREEVRRALRIALKVPREQWATFDRLVSVFWGEEPSRPPPPDVPAHGAPPAARVPRRVTLRWDPEARRLDDGVEARPEGEGTEPAFSPTAVLKRKSFEEAWSPEEMAAMYRLLARLVRRLASRPSRRWVPTPRRHGRIDVRRSLRRALGADGELLDLARRRPAIEQPRLVFLCDTSGSMDTHTRFVLAFVLGLRRVAHQAELFAFNTALCHLTPVLDSGGGAAGRVALSPDKIGLSLRRLPGLVPDWSGGTRIGESLRDFVDRYLPRMVGPRTVVTILSDGLDRGDPTLITDAMRAIHLRARRVLWLNPLLGGPSYEPTAAGMKAALPFVDCFAPAHNLECLERLVRQWVA